MKVHEWEEYLNQVTSFIRFKHDHFDIRAELRAHLEDRTEELMAEGYAEAEAQHMALDAMGDAREIGEALDKEHGPFLGWIWWMIRALRILMVILLLPTVLNTVLICGYTIIDAIQAYEILPEEKYGPLIFVTKPDVRGKIDDVHIIIDEVRRYEGGTVEVCYRTWINPLANSQKWTFGLGNCFYDENGNDNFYGGGGSSGGFVSHHHDRLEEFPRASQLLIIDYDYNGRKFYAEIPLTEEGGGLLLAD